MKPPRRPTRLLLAVVLCLGLFLPLRVSAAGVYFTAINDSVAPLTSDTMPFWSGGVLYVPYTVFDAAHNSVGVDLGIISSYSRTKNTVALYNTNQILIFDLNDGSCRDDLTGQSYDAQAIMRNGLPYLPVGTVCSFFGLTYTYSALPSISQGYLVRIKSSSVVLSDADFIDAAWDLINRRLKDYTQSLSSAATTSPGTGGTSSGSGQNESSGSVSTYLALTCSTTDGLNSALNTLDSQGVYAVFFLTPQLLETEHDLVRRILGSGHSVGIWVQEASTAQSLRVLEQGNRTLEQLVHTRTTLAYAPEDQRAALEAEGWVCWDETLLLSPSSSVGPSSFADSTLRYLSGRGYATYLTLEGGSNGARVLPTLLRRLEEERFFFRIPMETSL